MQSILIKYQRTGQNCRDMTPIARSRLAVLGLLGLLSCAQLARADGLRWKLKPGDVLRYALEEKMTRTTTSMGRLSKSNTSRTTNLSWTVKGVSDSGDADIVLRYERLRMHIEEPPLMAYDLDSSAPKLDAPEPFGSAARQLKAMAGAEFTFRLKPSGAIEDIKIPETTLKALREGDPNAAAQGNFSEQALKGLIAQVTPPPFPENASEPGRSWISKPTKFPTPYGNVSMDTTFTTTGPDPKNPNILLIGTETKVSIEPQEDAPLSAKIQSQEGKGTIAFDTASGRIVSVRHAQKTQMLITQTANPNQSGEENTETVSTLTLEP